ncbi:MAG: sterol desaturase family protein [Candidatus Binatus sp.]|nr:sterol desaturase family protein [Candidatus Binatus sp.]
MIAMMIDCVIFAAGILAWTMLEYVIHGVMGHAHRTFVTPMHQVHHRDPRAVFALGAWIPTLAVLLGGLYLFGATRGMIFLGGIAAGFACYELIHYRIHFSKPIGSVESRLRARHLAHHFHKPGQIFGVTTPLWDYVVGSEPAPAEMRALSEAGARIAPLDGPSNFGRMISAARASIRGRITAS